MAENVTNELIFETLKTIRKDITDLRSEVREHAAVQRRMLDRMAGFTRFEADQEGVNMSLRERVERIERRLELRD